MSSQPIENAAQTAANGRTASMPAVDAPVTTDTGSVKLPTTQELLDQVEKSQQADAASVPAAPQQATFTANSAVNSAPMAPSETARRLDAVALMRSMSDFVKAQNRFIHDRDIARLASGQEAHIVALTTALEQLGVL